MELRRFWMRIRLYSGWLILGNAAAMILFGWAFAPLAPKLVLVFLMVHVFLTVAWAIERRSVQAGKHRDQAVKLRDRGIKEPK